MPMPTLAVFDRQVDGLTPGGQLYARSYLQIRLLIGLTGFLLPLSLVGLDWLFMTEGRQIQGSMSAYYHTPARDLFVAGLCVVGVLLLTYLTAQLWTWDFVLSSLAGVCVLVVAFFPTWRPGLSQASTRCGESPLTPPGCTALQQRFGEQQVATVHSVAAVTFVVLLAALSLVFAARAKHDGEPDTRRHLYLTCAAVIVLAGLWAILGPTLRLSTYSVQRTYAGEFVAFYAFSISWFAASWDLISGILRKATPGRLVHRSRMSVTPSPARGGRRGASASRTS
jgi:hypothetical protein